MQEAAAIRAAADAENQQAYEAALRRAGLTPAAAPGPLHMIDPNGPRPDGNVYITGTWSEENREPPTAASFARDAEGRLWHIDRRPRATVAEPLRVEGCADGYSGGVTPMQYEVGYTLPEGVTIAGRKQIEYPARSVFIRHADGPCYKGPPRP